VGCFADLLKYRSGSCLTKNPDFDTLKMAKCTFSGMKWKTATMVFLVVPKAKGHALV
jgi:hypothetical protein